MILELNNRLERLGLSVGLQTVLHVCPTTGQQCGPALLILDCYSSQLPSHSDSDTLDPALMTLHIPSLPLQVYLACPPALDVSLQR